MFEQKTVYGKKRCYDIQKYMFYIKWVVIRPETGHIMGTPAASGRAGGGHPQGFRSLSQRVFIR